MNINNNRKVLFFLILSVAVVVFLAINQIFISQYVYKMIINNHITLTNQLFSIATEGISQYINSMKNSIESITKYKDITEFNEEGENIISEFQVFYEDYFSNVTRLDHDGTILYTYPESPSAIGKNVLYQSHNKRLFDEKRTIISTPFMAVQGYEAIAIAVPVFRDNEFDGSVTGLIPFKKIWDLFVSEIHLSEHSFIVVCDGRNHVIYAPDFMSDVETIDEMIVKFVIDNDTLNMDKLNGNFISLKNEGNEERYLFVADYLHIENNKWCILGFTPESDLKRMNYRLSFNQMIFTYLVILLLVIISVIFIYHQNSLLQRTSMQFNRTFEEKEKIKDQKHFFETVVKKIMQLRGLTIILTEENGEIVYRSTDLRWLKGNLFKSMEEQSVARLHSNMEFMKKGNSTTAILIPLSEGKKSTRYMFSTTILHYGKDTYLFFAGLEYDAIKSELTDGEINVFSTWMGDERTLCLLKNDGSIMAFNRTFMERFGRKDSITDICSGPCKEKIMETVKNTVENLSETAVTIHSEGASFEIIMNPVFDEFLKPQTVSVEIK